ncbi:MAG: SBBP repeat-containing protein [bacterium]
MKASFILAFLFFLLPLAAFAQLDSAWLRSVDGAGLEDIFSDMVVDASGNVYITGMTWTSDLQTDILVRKFSPDGAVVWSASYDGAAHNEDSASAMVVDSADNVYVCGWTVDSLGHQDMVTVKFSYDGQLVWAKTWSRALNGDDAAYGLCLDRLGRVIVTGYCSDTIPGNIDYCTICYNANTGDTVWVRYYNRTPENDEDISYSICVDDSNNIYVTGTSYDDGTDYDITTIRYQSDGTRVWLRRKNYWPWMGDDYGIKVVFDPVTRTIVVGGIVWDDNQDYNYFTMKYSKNGDSLWARAYNRYPANDEDLLNAVALDRSGNVFVTGTSYDNVTDYDIATVAYSSNGVPQWSQRLDAEGLEDGGFDIVVDSLGGVLVVGTVETSNNYEDVTILKYKSSGEFIYAYRWDNPVSHDEDWGYRVAVQPDGHIIFGGTTYSDSTDADLIVCKLFEVQHDFALAGLILPESLYIEDTLKNPRAVVANLSINPDSCWVHMTIEPGDYQDSLWISLMPGMLDTVLFKPFLAETVGLITVTSWVNLAQDERRLNDTSWAEVVVWQESVGVGEEKIVARELNLTVTPNPVRTTGVVSFDLPPTKDILFKLYERTGVLVREFKIIAGNKDTRYRFDVRDLAAGVYFLCLNHKTGCLTRKVVIQR